MRDARVYRVHDDVGALLLVACSVDRAVACWRGERCRMSEPDRVDCLGAVLVDHYGGDQAGEPRAVPESRWLGRPLSQLTREELSEALETMGRYVESIQNGWTTERWIQGAFQRAEAPRS